MLVETALGLCDAHSAGIRILDPRLLLSALCRRRRLLESILTSLRLHNDWGERLRRIRLPDVLPIAPSIRAVGSAAACFSKKHGTWLPDHENQETMKTNSD